jgi:hypothetical protein
VLPLTRSAGRRQPRHVGQQHRRDDREQRADPQQTGVDRQIERAHREARGVAREDGDHRPRAQHSQQRAGAAQQQALGQQRPSQRTGARAERGPDRQLAFATHRAREDQVGDVRAGDDEDERGGGEQRQQHRARVRRDLIAQLHGVDLEVRLRRVVFPVILDHRRVDRAQLGAGGVEVGARRQPAEQLRHPMHAARHHRRREVMRTADDVGDDFRLRRVGDRRLEDAHDRRRPRVQPNLLADHRRVAVQRRRPEAIGEHHRAGRVRAIVIRADEAAEHGAQAHHLEVGAADDPGSHLARIAQADHGEADGREVADGAERLDPRPQVQDLRHREVDVFDADALGALLDVNQAILVSVRQRPQQHAADDAEDRGIGADAERQREHHGRCQTLGAGQGADREFHVVPEGHRSPHGGRSLA